MGKKRKTASREKLHPADNESSKDFIIRHTQPRLRVTFDLHGKNALAHERRTPADVLKVQLSELIAQAVADNRLSLASLGISLNPQDVKVDIDL